MPQSADTIFCDTAQIFQYQISQQHHFLVRWWGRYLHSTWYLLVHLLLTLPCFLEDLPREVSLHGSSLSLCGFPKHVLVLSDRAMIKQPRIVAQGPVTRKMNMQCELYTKYCLLGLYHVDITHKWERAGCGLVCFIFFFFCCLFVLFLRKYIDRIAE